MKKHAKEILLVLVIIYVLSPIDLTPGPIDDAIVSIFTIVASKAGSLFKYL